MSLAARLLLPARVAPGDVVVVRLLIQHPMETGLRHDVDGKRIARHVLTSVRCEFDGREVFRAEISSGLSANPLLEFPVRVTRAGEWRVSWEDDRGARFELRQTMPLGG